MKVLFLSCIFAGFIPIVYGMYRMHPNENVYFNALIGGLPGAMQYGLDGANNSYGNAYKQGINWLNTNAEKGATISLGAAIASANPTIYYRKDLRVVADVTNLYQQGGEYIIELAYPGMVVGDFFRMRFAKNFLVPIHTVSVDGVVLLSIWKNTPGYTRKDIDLKQESEVTVKREDIDDTLIHLSLPQMRRLKRVEFFYDPSVCASTAHDISLAVSQGRKMPWYRLRGTPTDFMLERVDYGASDIYQLAGEYASEIKLYGNPSSGCLPRDIEVKVIVFP